MIETYNQEQLNELKKKRKYAPVIQSVTAVVFLIIGFFAAYEIMSGVPESYSDYPKESVEWLYYMITSIVACTIYLGFCALGLIMRITGRLTDIAIKKREKELEIEELKEKIDELEVKLDGTKRT